MAYQSNEEIAREIAKRKAEAEVRRDMAKRDTERKNLKRQLFKLKYARAIKIAKAVGRGSSRIGTAVAKEIRRTQRKSTRKSPKRRVGYSFNANPFNIRAPRF